MKLVKRCLLAALVCLSAMIMLTACGANEVKYPVIEPMDTTGVTLASTQNTELKFSYPADTWISVPEIVPLTLLYTATAETENAVNINVQASTEFSGTLSDDDLQSLIAELEAYRGYITIDLAELRQLNGQAVIYTESTIQITDEYLDFMVENGMWTEAGIEASGGRDFLKSIPATTQVSIYAVVDDYLFLYIGTYYDEVQKQDVIDTMTVMIASSEKIR